MEQKLATFNIQDLLPIGLTIVVLGIGLGYGLNVLSDVKSDMTSGTDEWNAVNDTVLGVSKLPAKLPLIVTVIVAAVIIGLLVRYLMVRYR